MKLVKEYINEKFSENSDPIYDIGIGLPKLIEVWLKKHNRYSDQSHYSINIDGTIDIDRFLFNDKVNNLKEFPDYINFNKANYFDCSFRSLKSLKGTPRIVKGEFSCIRSKITSLKYGPLYADRYYVYNCEFLTSLEGIKIVNTFLIINNTPITKKNINKILKQKGVSIKDIYYGDNKAYTP